MGRQKLSAGQASESWEARRQVVGDDGKYRSAKPGERGRRTDKWRAQGSVRDDRGRLVPLQRIRETKTAAETALRAALKARAHSAPGGELTPTSTLREAGEFWRRHITTNAELSDGTRRLYFIALDLHILGLAGSANLADVELRNIRVSNLEPALRAVAEGSGAGMMRTTRSVYRAILLLAVRHDAIPHNPVSDLGALEVHALERETGRDPRRTFTIAELARVIERADATVDLDLGDLLAFLAGTSLRIGEACAIRWEDLELERGLAKVGEYTVVRIKGDGLHRVRHGRTKAFPRVIQLPQWLVDRLGARQASNPFVDNPWGVVFPSPLGKLRDPSNTLHRIKEVLGAVNGDEDGKGESVPLSAWATSHTFRKTAITAMHDAGLSDRQVANVSGHHSIPTMQSGYFGRRGVATGAAEVLTILVDRS